MPAVQSTITFNVPKNRGKEKHRLPMLASEQSLQRADRRQRQVVSALQSNPAGDKPSDTIQKMTAKRATSTNAASDPIGDFLNETRHLLQELDAQTAARARDLLLDCYRRGGRVFTLGNGGSASYRTPADVSPQTGARRIVG